MAKSAGYVSADYLRKAAEQISNVKERTYELMNISAGSSVLDVGCGPGMDTVPLAKIVGSAGKVVGVDIDAEMLKDADALAQKEGVGDIVEHVAADVTALNFPDNSFDAVRAERLFQVLPAVVNPEDVFAQLVRVTRPGGSIVLLDADWGSFSVDYSNGELEQRLTAFFASKLRPNGYAGRQLFGWCQHAGLNEISIENFAHIQTDIEQMPVGPWLQGEALTAGVANPIEIDAWATELQSRNDSGQFFASVNMFLVSGQKP